MLQITAYCHIKKNKVYLNGKLLFEDPGADSLKTFSVKVFRHFKFKYPKFFKMDEISKLGFLGAEIMLSAIREQIGNADVGIVLSNSQSTLVTDKTFQESISDKENFFPSPSVFVYTLPNIMIGEISIRNKYMGENAFFIFDRFNAEYLCNHINLLNLAGKLTHCLGGWVDQTTKDYEAFLYFTSPEQKEVLLPGHSAEVVRKLYELI